MFEITQTGHVRRGGAIKRIAAVSAAVLLVLVAGAAAYLKFFFDPNAYKPRLAAAATEYLGRAVTIDGDVSVALLPAPHARIDGIRVAEEQGFGDEPFVQIDAADLSARLWPLLLRRIEIASVAIDGARVHLQRDRAGRANWADLGPRQDADAPQRDHSSAPARALPRLRVHRSEIRFDDERAKRHIVLSDLLISAAASAEASWAAIHASAQIASAANAPGRGGKEHERGALSVTAEAAVRPEHGVYAMRDARLRFQSAGTPGSTAFAADITGAGSFDTNTNAVIASLAISALDLAIKAELNAQPGADARAPTRLDGKLGVNDFDLRALLKKLGKTVPPMRDPSMLGHARLALDLSGDSKRVVVRPSGQLDDSALGGEITVQNPFERPVIRFVLLIDKLNADRYRPPSPKAPSPYANDPLAALSLGKLRELGLDMRGEIRVGTLILNGDRTRNFIAKLDWNP